jgi:hypothetical protein
VQAEQDLLDVNAEVMHAERAERAERTSSTLKAESTASPSVSSFHARMPATRIFSALHYSPFVQVDDWGRI